MWVNKNAGDATKWTYDPDLSQQAVDDGTWKKHDGAGHVADDATQQARFLDRDPVSLPTLRGRRRWDGARLWRLNQVARVATHRRKPSEPADPGELDVAVTNRLLLEANAQLGPYFWWGQRQKNSYDATTIPVTENGGVVPGITYRAGGGGNQGSRRGLITGRSRTSCRAPPLTSPGHTRRSLDSGYHHNDAYYPIDFYNNSQLSYIFQDGVPHVGDCLRRCELESATAAEHDRALRAGSLDVGTPLAAGWAPLGASCRSLPQQQMGPNLFLPTPVVFPTRTARSLKRT
jgi:hypothetical protein